MNQMENNNFVVVDVRTREEFSGGHVAGSINIPLQEVVDRKDEIFDYGKPVIFCCASGNRSGQAAMYFKSLGLECENGGSWMDVNYKMNA
jgi:phage shock protein E